MEICLLAAGTAVRLGTAALTLTWTHSVEKTRWEEDWRLDSQRLAIVETRIESSGAGMEPQPGAKFDGRWWRWRPMLTPLPQVVLRRSHMTDDWSFCIDGSCRPAGAIVPPQADPVTMVPC